MTMSKFEPRPHRITVRIDDFTRRTIDRLKDEWPETFTSDADVFSRAITALAISRDQMRTDIDRRVAALRDQLSDI